MKNYKCSPELKTLLTNLRACQKAFFKAKPGSLEKIEAIKSSKELEKELDRFLEEGTEIVQPTLFNPADLDEF